MYFNIIVRLYYDNLAYNKRPESDVKRNDNSIHKNTTKTFLDEPTTLFLSLNKHWRADDIIGYINRMQKSSDSN